MQISTEVNGEFLEMRVAGRLDNEWSAHLSKALDEAIRQGSHSIVMDLNEVEYLSSAGIGALVRAFKQFQAIHGFFGVATAAPQVSEVIRLTGLGKMLLCDPAKLRRSGDRSQTTVMPEFRFAAVGGTLFEVYDIDPKARLTAQLIGNPDQLAHSSYSAADCRRYDFPQASFGLGQGAFGSDFSDCSNRFGEFLAVGGSAAQLPTNGTGKPDYQLGTGNFVPSVQTLYGIRCEGAFASEHRFEPNDPQERISFTKLVEQSLNLTKSNLAGMVFLAETAGLVGASLRRSPAVAEEGAAHKFSHPEIRRWLSFSPERVFPHSLALIVGVAGRNLQGEQSRLNPMLRPLGPQTDISAHFHAAVFSYRPFKKRKLNLDETVTTLFESEDLQSVLHLLHDDRPISGCGESEFVRGACWISPISAVQQEGV